MQSVEYHQTSLVGEGNLNGLLFGRVVWVGGPSGGMGSGPISGRFSIIPCCQRRNIIDTRERMEISDGVEDSR